MKNKKIYQYLREFKVGNKLLKGPLRKLQVWFEDKYKITPINVRYSYIKGTDCSQVIFYFEEHKDIENLKIDKEIISSKFVEYTNGYKSYKSNKVIVLFGYFKTHARIHAIRNISHNELYELAFNIGLKNIQSIFREPFSTCYVLFDDKETQEKYSSVEFINRFKKGYLELLKRNDEFDYHSDKTFEIKFWNKVEFDETYDNFYHFAHG